MSHRCPPELLDEIISYLWNDIPSLKACSLAHRNTTVPSQKRLFYAVGLRGPNQRVKNEMSGTSYDFWRLLVGSPHIAGYVQSLFIMDIIDFDPSGSEDDQTNLNGYRYGKYVV